MSFEPLFLLRHRIARVGEQDWMQWWNSHALTPTGAFLTPRLFRRTPRLSAAHLSIATARVRHAALVPAEPLVHLFDFGEVIEGEFERWLIERKAAGWEPPALAAPTPEARSGAAALAAVGVEVHAVEGDDGVRTMTAAPSAAGGSAGGGVVLGQVSRTTLESPARRLTLARRLAAAYAASAPGALTPPFFRVADA